MLYYYTSKYEVILNLTIFNFITRFKLCL